jgi:uncharacterized OB-fold protein
VSSGLLTLPNEWQGPVPAYQLEYAPFWEGVRQHRLSIQRCSDCRRWIHLPAASCPSCSGDDLVFEPVSGEGEVYSYTVVQREFGLHLPLPWVAAIVQLDEDPAIHLSTNIVNCTPETISIGAPVRVVYKDYSDWLTLAYFEPIAGSAA